MSNKRKGKNIKNSEVHTTILLNKLVVNNFKSFQGNHEIGFFQNYTAILGANGSGKSNIIDAISFVCGINSKYLRVENLKKLVNNTYLTQNNNKSQISSSTQGKKAEILSVELHLKINSKNSQKESQMDMVLARKLYESKCEYYIDNKKLSLEEYIERIEEYNISKFAKFFIIAQGSIDNILNSKSQLTEIIEGLSDSIKLKPKYEKFKEELEINNQLIQDLQKQITFIKKNRKDLQSILDNDANFDELNEKLNEILVKIFLNKLLQQDNIIEENHNSYLDSLISYKKLIDKKQEHVIKLQDLKIKIRKIQNNQSNKNSESLEIENSITTLNEKKNKLKHIQEKFIHLENQIMSKISILNSERNDFNKKKIKINFYEKEKQLLIHKKSELSKSLSKNIGLNELSDSQLIEFTQLKHAFEIKNSIEINEKTKLEKIFIELEEEYIKISAIITSYEDEINKLSKDLEILENQENQLNNKILEYEENIKNKIISYGEKERVINNYSQELSNYEKIYLENAINIEKHQNQLGISNKRKLIKEARISGVVGFLNELIQPIHKKYELAIKVSLLKHLNYLVVEDFVSAKKCLNYFDENDISQEVLVLEQLPNYNNSNSLNENFSSISQYGTPIINLILIKKQEIRPVLNHFLKNLFFCSEKLNISKLQSLGFKNIILIDGTVIKKGVFTGGTYKNLLSFENEFDSDFHSLTKEQKTLETKIEKLSYQVKELNQEIIIEDQQIKELEVNITLIKDKLNLVRSNKKLQSNKKDDLLEKSRINKIKQDDIILDKTSKEGRIKVLEIKIKELKKSFYREFYNKNKTSVNKSNKPNKLNKTENEDNNDYDFKIFEINDIEFIHKESLIIEEKINKIDSDIFDIKEQEKFIAKLEEDLENEKRAKNKLTKDEKIEMKDIEDIQETIDKLKHKLSINNDIISELNTKVSEEEKEVSKVENRIRALYKNKLEYEFLILKSIKLKSSLLEEFKLNLNNYLSKFNFAVLNNFSLNVNDYIIDKSIYDLKFDDENKNETQENILQEINYLIDYSLLEKSNKSKSKLKDRKILQNPTSELEILEKEFQETLTQKDYLSQFQLKCSSSNSEDLAEKEEKLHDQKKNLEKQLNEILKKNEEITRLFNDVQNQRKALFEEYLFKLQNEILIFYGKFYEDILISFDNCAKILNTNSIEPYLGITIFCPNPPGKRKTCGLSSLSGGEKTIAIIALILAMQKLSNIPFIIFDEIDAYLDKKHEEILEKQIIEKSKKNQIILITHKSSLSRSAESMIGTYYNKKLESSIVISIDMSQISLN